MLEAYGLFFSGLFSAINPMSLLYVACGVVWGIIAGATPGISASLGMALILPMTYTMDPMLSLPMLCAVYVGAEYGGSIPAILIRTPGTAAAGATAIDGYEMNKRGLGGKALCTSLFAGVTGGIISVIILVAVVIPLSRLALKFGPTQYFWLAICGLCLVGGLSGDNQLKGIVSAAFGLLLSTVGRDTFTGNVRFSFGIYQLAEGLELVGVMVGLFAIGETLKNIRNHSMFLEGKAGGKVKMTYPSKKELRQILPVSLSCGVLGTFIGAMPGAGATISAWIAYAQAKIFCKGADKTFGTGTDVRAIAAPESANNAVPAGALIPLLALGIPGSNSTAILMAGFTIAGIACGPILFINEPAIPYRLMACMLIAQFALLLLGFVFLKPSVLLTSMNKINLAGAIMLLSLTGAFATSNQSYTIFLVIFVGLIGYVLAEGGYSAPAAVLGYVLGELVEDNLRRSLQLSNGSFSIFFKGTINQVLIAIILVTFLYPHISELRSASKAKKEKE